MSSEIEIDLAEARDERRFHLVLQVVRYAGLSILLVTSTIPIKALGQAIRPFAGETTSFDLNVVMSVTLVASLGGVAGLLWKTRSQAKELQRERARADKLEKELRRLTKGRR